MYDCRGMIPDLFFFFAVSENGLIVFCRFRTEQKYKKSKLSYFVTAQFVRFLMRTLECEQSVIVRNSVLLTVLTCVLFKVRECL